MLACISSVSSYCVKITDFCDEPVQATKETTGGTWQLNERPVKLQIQPAGSSLPTQSAAYGGG